MIAKYKMYVDGSWNDSHSGDVIECINPYNQEVWATIPRADEEDAKSAIDAARAAFDGKWSKTTGYERSKLMLKLSELLDENAEQMAVVETTGNGKVIRETRTQMHFAARAYRFFAGQADKIMGETIPQDNRDILDYTIYEPLGVAVLIVAWNSPMQLLSNKLAPALATGNAVVVKPSSMASVSTLELLKLVERAGFPRGVVNVVTGGGEVGELLIKNKKINKVSFTGGSDTGKIVAKSAAENLVPVSLELGGKSPNVIFSDADMKAAVIGALAGIFAAAGQSCIAGSRLLVQRPVYDQVVSELVSRAKSIKLGNPLEQATEMGPVANKPQFTKIMEYISSTKDSGLSPVVGGGVPSDESLQRGFFIEPTIFSDVTSDMSIAREEIFGPVLSILPFETEEEAVEISNSVEFGLASGVWTNDLSRAHKMAREIKAGTVWINTYRMAAAMAPFGGVKRSGYGRERGLHALKDYLSVKNVMIDLSRGERDPFSIRV
jgi:acyl-CoA reductase-like NAD-dependent aldehyde dehydrogenase